MIFSQEGDVFLSACQSIDKAEVEELLANGADVNTASVDGLTALHQVCLRGKTFQLFTAFPMS